MKTNAKKNVIPCQGIWCILPPVSHSPELSSEARGSLSTQEDDHPLTPCPDLLVPPVGSVGAL